MKRNVGEMSEEGGGGKRRMVQNQRSKEKKIRTEKAQIIEIGIPARI